MHEATVAVYKRYFQVDKVPFSLSSSLTSLSIPSLRTTKQVCHCFHASPCPPVKWAFASTRDNKRRIIFKCQNCEDLNLCLIHVTTRIKVGLTNTRVARRDTYSRVSSPTVVRGVNWLLVKRSFVRFVRRTRPSRSWFRPRNDLWQTGRSCGAAGSSRCSLFLLIILPPTLIYRIYILRPVSSLAHSSRSDYWIRYTMELNWFSPVIARFTMVLHARAPAYREVQDNTKGREEKRRSKNHEEKEDAVFQRGETRTNQMNKALLT